MNDHSDQPSANDVTKTDTMEAQSNSIHKAPRKNIGHYFYEFLMLFLSVFSGFIAENLREQYGENQRAKELAQNLYKEILSDSISVEYQLE